MDPRIVRLVTAALDATPERLREIARLPNFEAACKALEETKAEAHRRYKRLAFEWHPDRNPGNPEAEAKFKVLGQVLKDLDKLQLQRPPQVVRRVIHFYPASPFGGSVTTSTSTINMGPPFWHPVDGTSATAASRPYDARRVVYIKF